jgi:hypothetical protein
MRRKEVIEVQNIEDGDLLVVLDTEQTSCCGSDCDCGPLCPPDCC